MPEPQPLHVVGVKDVLNGLSFIDENMRQKIRVVIDPLMRGVAEKAKSFVASNGQVLSGWSSTTSSPDVKYKPFPKYDAQVVREGIGYNPGENKTTKNGFKVSNYVYNVSRAGSIYETAGRLNPNGRAPFQFRTSKGDGATVSKRSARSKAFEYYDSNNPFASAQFIGALEPVTAQPKVKDVRGGGRKTKGRLIYKAWAQDSIKVYEAIVKAINASATDFTRMTALKEKKAA
jgi:hypothetical protein